MSVATNQSIFVFSEGFDYLSINDLYGQDLGLAAEVFGSSAIRVRESLDLARARMKDGDGPEALRRIVHHIKPVFGYTGQPALKAVVERFESLCMSDVDRERLATEFLLFEQAMLEAAGRVEREHQRLISYINRTV
jgi:hypothetical protein